MARSSGASNCATIPASSSIWFGFSAPSNDGTVIRLQDGQTTGEYMVNMGAWTEEQAASAPIGGALISAVGADEMTPAVGLVDLQAGDTLLLCTDGLTRHVSDERITELLGRGTDAAGACRELMDEALAGGRHDNITVIVARMV